MPRTTSYSRATGRDLADAVDDPFETLLAADLRVALAGEDPADGARASQPTGDLDQFRLAVDGALLASGSGLVKSGEQQSIGMAKPAAPMASPTRSI